MNILTKHKKKILIGILIIVLLLTVLIFLPSKKLNAVAFLPFGGVITTVTYCPCSSNLLVTVTGPVSGNFVFQPGVSILFPFGQIYRPGPFILGTFAPGGACMMFKRRGCFALPSTGTIGIVGTSL